MPRIALATQAELPASEVDDAPLHRALIRRGAHLDRPTWDDPAVDWGAFDAVLIRTTWDYAARRDRFVAWAEEVAARTALFNPVEVVRWNTDKRYLRDLQRAGVPIAPTVWLAPGPSPDVGALLAERGWTRGFLKPVFGQTARETLRFDASPAGLAAARAHLDRLLPREGFMLQPYLSAVEREGEHSAIFVDGALTHVVQKIPVPGDYRVMDDFGATDRRATLDPDGHAVCRAALAAVPAAAPLLYARVDLLRDDRGRWVLTELELVEPSLFFRHGPHAADALAASLMRRVAAPPGPARP